MSEVDQKTYITREVVAAWDLHTYSRLELLEMAADWGYGDCPEKFAKLVEENS